MRAPLAKSGRAFQPPDAAFHLEALTGQPSAQHFRSMEFLHPQLRMIENVVGLVRMDAAEQRIEWLPGGSGRMGMKNLPLGGNRISLVLENDRISVDCIQPFRLIFRGRELACPAGRSVIEILLG